MWEWLGVGRSTWQPSTPSATRAVKVRPALGPSIVDTNDILTGIVREANRSALGRGSGRHYRPAGAGTALILFLNVLGDPVYSIFRDLHRLYSVVRCRERPPEIGDDPLHVPGIQVIGTRSPCVTGDIIHEHGAREIVGPGKKGQWVIFSPTFPHATWILSKLSRKSRDTAIIRRSSQPVGPARAIPCWKRGCWRGRREG